VVQFEYWDERRLVALSVQTFSSHLVLAAEVPGRTRKHKVLCAFYIYKQTIELQAAAIHTGD